MSLRNVLGRASSNIFLFSQTLVVVMTIVLFIVVFKEPKRTGNFGIHQFLGYVVLALSCIQLLLAIFRNQISGFNPSSIPLDAPPNFKGKRLDNELHCDVDHRITDDSSE